MSAHDVRRTATSLAKGPAVLIGLVLLAYGVSGIIFGSSDFTEQAFDGTVDGERWLGLEANGWTNLLILGSGALLILSAPLHVAVKGMAMLGGLALGAAALIALGDGDDALGIFAVDEPMKIALGVAAASLLAVALLPRVGGDRVVADEPPRQRDNEADRRLPARPAGPGYSASRHDVAEETQVVWQPERGTPGRSQDAAPVTAPQPSAPVTPPQAPAQPVAQQDAAAAPAPAAPAPAAPAPEAPAPQAPAQPFASQEAAPAPARTDAGMAPGQAAAQPVSTSPVAKRRPSTLDRARRRLRRR